MTDPTDVTQAAAPAPTGNGAAVDAVLALDDVHTYYGNIHALKGVTMEVGKGEIVSLIGSNGAGKSTTLRTISGIQRARQGSVMLNGRDITAMAGHEVVKLGIAHSPEGRHVFTRMSVHENLELGAFIRQGEPIGDDMARVFDLFPRLRERRSQKAGTLSGGEQQMLAMGRALMSRPKVLLLDEPSMGLSPIMVDKIFEVVDTIHKQGTTILLVEQNASRALSLANRGYVMDSGEITMSGPARQLLEDPKVRAAYLGE